MTRNCGIEDLKLPRSSVVLSLAVGMHSFLFLLRFQLLRVANKLLEQLADLRGGPTTLAPRRGPRWGVVWPFRDLEELGGLREHRARAPAPLSVRPESS